MGLRLIGPDWCLRRPFWADREEKGRKVTVLDVPYSFAGALKQGVEISDWGTHGQTRPLAANRADVREFLRGFGPSPIGRETPNPSGWAGIQPWTFGYYYYGTATNDAQGWLMIDHKALTYPIGFVGGTYTNETPYTSAHASGGANFAMCDGSVRFFQPETSLDVLQQLATRSQDEAVELP